MTRTFTPRLDILPTAQRELWPSLRGISDIGFTLYGGTALALRYGHRESVDFDFFSSDPLDLQRLREAIPFIDKTTTIQESVDTWVVLTPGPDPVKLSFFGGIAFGRVGEPEWTDDRVLLVASPEDLMATKLKVILQRAEAKDYRDIAELICAGHDLSHGLSCSRQMFGSTFQPAESVRALVYFNDGDLSELEDRYRKILIDASGDVDDRLAAVHLKAKTLGVEISDMNDMDDMDESGGPPTAGPGM